MRTKSHCVLGSLQYVVPAPEVLFRRSRLTSGVLVQWRVGR
jgi:hypothetical protein